MNLVPLRPELMSSESMRWILSGTDELEVSVRCTDIVPENNSNYSGV